MATKRKKPAVYMVSDGKIQLRLEDAGDGWFVVTVPSEPGVVTQARSIAEAFYMAYDARSLLAVCRRDLHRWEKAEAATGRKFKPDAELNDTVKRSKWSGATRSMSKAA